MLNLRKFFDANLAAMGRYAMDFRGAMECGGWGRSCRRLLVRSLAQ